MEGSRIKSYPESNEELISLRKKYLCHLTMTNMPE